MPHFDVFVSAGFVMEADNAEEAREIALDYAAMGVIDLDVEVFSLEADQNTNPAGGC